MRAEDSGSRDLVGILGSAAAYTAEAVGSRRRSLFRPFSHTFTEYTQYCRLIAHSCLLICRKRFTRKRTSFSRQSGRSASRKSKPTRGARVSQSAIPHLAGALNDCDGSPPTPATQPAQQTRAAARSVVRLCGGVPAKAMLC